ncbi:hypothetical protein A9G11_11930 [Gilliamella sp. wkB108]|uniref:DUF1799 domain-containing protein n=1 Tax=Gilliamella sp. wkB108 TaxID=3120256 RepID=UPI00080DDD37|nr:DUF1799 domain-containing protein [Gilliamella apicola]OCG28206.1 hypothetical protein A9G11_11930 [Gilliamella apicola]
MTLVTALYTSEPSKEELAAFGLTEDDYEDEYIEVWQDNLDALRLFSAMSTQWRTSIGGITGLDYNCLPWVMKMQNIKEDEHIFSDIQLMESEALKIVHQSK